MAISNKDEKVTKSYDEKLLNLEFARNWNSLSSADTISGVHCFIAKNKEWKGCRTNDFSKSFKKLIYTQINSFMEPKL